jgi:hypothetical protein
VRAGTIALTTKQIERIEHKIRWRRELPNDHEANEKK